jgi:hypothetical protein
MNHRRNWALPIIALCAACGSSDASIPSPTGGTDGSPSAGHAPTNDSGAKAAAGHGTAGTTSAVGGTNAAGTGNAGTTGAAGAAGQPMAAAAGSGGGAAAPDPNSPDCRGIDMTGLLYSPGGDVLPNKCLPFDPTTNNPYAVRCVDAWPWYKTSFSGDVFCILPPPPDKGIQYGVHPQGKQWFAQVSTGNLSGYDNLAAGWTLPVGGEEEKNYETSIDNAMPQNYYRTYVRMRPGSHHMIVSTDTANTQAVGTWAPGSPGGLFGGTGLPGAQRPDENAPKSLAKPDEDKGLYSQLPAMPNVVFDMHHFNATEGTILKEAWVNLWWETDATIQEQGILGLELSQTATLAVQPNTVVDLHYSWDITQPIRVISLFGHRHAWTSNFSSWVEEPNGDKNIVYQSFGWLDEPTYRYDSMTKNPGPGQNTDGGKSGIFTLQSGEKLHFNCHIEYTDARAMAEKAPMPAQNGVLHFANEAFSAEMCILFGQTAAVKLSGPAIDTSPLPDFATAD